MLPFCQKSFKKTTISILVFVVFSAASAHASILHLFSGKTIEGEIIEHDQESIKIDTGSGIPLTYYLDEIQTIDGAPTTAVPPVLDQRQPNAEEPETAPLAEPAESDRVIEPAQASEPPQPTVQPEISSTVIAESKKTPAKDTATLEGVEIFKEQPSPAAIKPKEAPAPIADVKPVNAVTLPSLSTGRTEVSNKPDIAAVAHRIFQSDFFKKTQQYFQSRAQESAQSRSRLKKRLSHIKKKLYEVPVKIRRDTLMFFSCFLTVIYILICYPLMRIARKLNKKFPWLIWIPIIQMFYFVAMAGRRLRWTIGFFVPFFNLIFPVFLFSDILKGLKKSSLLIVPIILPGANILALWYLALSKSSNEQVDALKLNL
ncbi:MAG TPA: hypothetical protein PKV41_02035 [Candidatus Omnitrophota bacterium]|nr:hypothetical protein [Candidatus Omnitrophota bacterium]